MSTETFYECSIEILCNEVKEFATDLHDEEIKDFVEKCLGVDMLTAKEFEKFKDEFENEFAEYHSMILAKAELRYAK